MSKIGYIRVSMEHQETARQQEIMCDYQARRIFSEKISGANKDRPQLRAMLDYVREGIEIAKAQGKYTGRKPIPTDWTRFGQLYGNGSPRASQGVILCGEWACRLTLSTAVSGSMNQLTALPSLPLIDHYF